MSRVIKFRAWLEFDERMVEWENLHLETDETGIFLWIGGDEDDNFGNASGESEFKLMQFTGLHDKNGVEIYEGDILEYGVKDYAKGLPVVIKKVGEVYFRFGAFWVGDRLVNETVREHEEKTGKVIGNIYQHPHLLEGS